MLSNSSKYSQNLNISPLLKNIEVLNAKNIIIAIPIKVKTYKSIDKLYEAIENNTDTLKEKLKEKLVENKDLAILSRTLGTINIEVPLEEKVEDLKNFLYERCLDGIQRDNELEK